MSNEFDLDSILRVINGVHQGDHQHGFLTTGNVRVSGSSILPHAEQARVDQFNWDADRLNARRHRRSPSSSVSRSSSFGSASNQSDQSDQSYQSYQSTLVTIPSRQSHLPPAMVDALVSSIAHNDESGLPCEFAIYSDCVRSFALDDTTSWIDHIIDDHLRNRLPIKSICWFCDDVWFYADERGIDARHNFVERLEHISDHIREEHLGFDRIRPDFHFLNHLHSHHMISDRFFALVRSWEGENPAPQIEGVHPPDYISPEQKRSRERSELVITKEPRQSRRSNGVRSPFFSTH